MEYHTHGDMLQTKNTKYKDYIFPDVSATGQSLSIALFPQGNKYVFFGGMKTSCNFLRKTLRLQIIRSICMENIWEALTKN